MIIEIEGDYRTGEPLGERCGSCYIELTTTDPRAGEGLCSYCGQWKA